MTFTGIDLRLKLHLYKVSFLLLTRKLKAAMREVKMAMNTARRKDYYMAVYLKSQLEYARGNHRESALASLLANSSPAEQRMVAKCVEIGLPELIIVVVFSQDKLRPVLTDIRKHADSIKGSQIVTGMDGGNLKADKGRKHLEEEYFELEEKV
ncbi:hypothetical protein POM88_001749 [Heracleum sosnowskyi]|uniref:Uncharacterized protein n=1 Tax=Heracleum sosnowskyi TaxID=360622 RepID=A0AAD8JDK8_9APIA|nr:hypothetical protein POM88_001749 [Heracleum sosnowskyi]